MEENKLPKIELETKENNDLKTYLDETIDLKEIIKEVQEDDSKWRKKTISNNNK